MDRLIKTGTHSNPTCCIVGGGPAGMILSLLLVRKGIQVTLLEAHRDFDRDFRGDPLIPAVMELMDDLGLTVISQKAFLEFMVAEASRYPGFSLHMGVAVQELIEENGTIRGVRYRTENGWRGLIPLKRMAEPHEIANMISFLVSEQSNYVAGTTLTVAGGE